MVTSENSEYEAAKRCMVEGQNLAWKQKSVMEIVDSDAAADVRRYSSKLAKQMKKWYTASSVRMGSRCGRKDLLTKASPIMLDW